MDEPESQLDVSESTGFGLEGSMASNLSVSKVQSNDGRTSEDYPGPQSRLD